MTVDDYLTTNGRHADRLRWVSDGVRDNATLLVERVNMLLARFGKKREWRSGFRDVDSNSNVGGAKGSRHMTGQGGDLEDDDRKLVTFITPQILEECGLWMEAPSSTPTWCHVQIVPPPSGRRIFTP